MAISDKLTYLNTTKSLIRDGINAIGGELTSSDTFRSYVNALNNIYDYLPKVTGSGTNISLDDTKKGLMRITLSPSELEQETTTGQQLYDYTDLQSTYSFLTYDSDGWYTVTYDNSNSSSGYYCNFTTKATDLLSTSTNYLLVSEIKTISYTGSGSFNPVDRWGQFTTATAYQFQNISANTTYVATKTTISDFTGEPDCLTSNVYVGANSKVTITFRLSLIADTSVTPSTFKYEPYTGGIPAPNPSYPETIHTISGSNKVVVNGKNLFDVNTLSNSDYVLQNDGSIVNNKNWGSDGRVYFNNLTLKAGTYTISYIPSFITGDRVRFAIKDSINSTDIANENILVVNNTKQTYTFTLNAETTIGICIMANNVGTNPLTIKEIQLEVGSTATTYTPYAEPQKVDIDLGDIEYCKIGDYADDFIRTSGKNLFDENYPNLSSTLQYMPLYVGDGTFTMSSNIPHNNSGASLFFLAGNVNTGASTGTNNVELNVVRTQTSVNGYVTIAYRNFDNLNNYQSMLNKGTTALDYEPYGSNEWYIKKNIGKVVLDGTETIATESTVSDKKRFRIGGISNVYKNSSSSDSSLIKCNMLSAGSIVDTYNDIQCISYDLSSSDYYKDFTVFINDTKDMTTAEFITWLSTNNLEVYYILATPTYTQITGTLAEELESIYNAQSKDGQTNISQINNDLAFIMNTTALKDLSEV